MFKKLFIPLLPSAFDEDLVLRFAGSIAFHKRKLNFN
jgi:hypothetical protein